jgi:aryl-alcohol dehydrogenase-like predicted oxidoreductase
MELDLGGLGVSRVGLGCNNFGGRLDKEATRAVVDAALAAGVTFFDTADIYGNHGGSERLLGEILEGRRDRVVLATKFGKEMGDGATSRGSADYIRHAIDASLERLRTDYVDLYYQHEPDPSTPIAETLGALDELVRAGQVRAIGCSNSPPASWRRQTAWPGRTARRDSWPSRTTTTCCSATTTATSFRAPVSSGFPTFRTSPSRADS